MVAHLQTTPYAFPPDASSSAKTWREFAPPTPSTSRTDAVSAERDIGTGTQQSSSAIVAPGSTSSTQIPGNTTLSHHRGLGYFQNHSDDLILPSLHGPSSDPAATAHAAAGTVPSSEQRSGSQSTRTYAQEQLTANAN
jgi:hypothetical protein